MQQLKPDYPKDITGTVTFSGDSSIDLDEIEIAYACTLTEKGIRKISNINVRFPSRHSGKGSRVVFESGQVILDYNDDKELYSMKLTSIDSMINKETMEPIDNSEIDQYIESTCDVELAIFAQVALQCWGALMDHFPMFDMCGNLIKNTIIASEEEPPAP